MLQNKEIKILWDFKIQTDKHLACSIPDIKVVEKKQMWLINMAIPGDSRIDQKEVEKVTKYEDLKVEVERLWEKKATAMPVVIGAFIKVVEKKQMWLINMAIPGDSRIDRKKWKKSLSMKT